MTETAIKKLGFRKKGNNKNEWEIHVEVAPKNYISISLLNFNGEFMFSGVEIDGDKANEVRKEHLKTFDLDEIIEFLEKF